MRRHHRVHLFVATREEVANGVRERELLQSTTACMRHSESTTQHRYAEFESEARWQKRIEVNPHVVNQLAVVKYRVTETIADETSIDVGNSGLVLLVKALDGVFTLKKLLRSTIGSEQDLIEVLRL